MILQIQSENDTIAIFPIKAILADEVIIVHLIKADRATIWFTLSNSK